jgi:hypothetical protein
LIVEVPEEPPVEEEVDGSPTLEPEAAYLYQQLRPIAGEDAEHGYATAHLCAALMKPVELISKLASEVGDRPGYADAVDLPETPTQLLPWLGQFSGTPLIDGEDPEEQRRKIREARGSHRGKVQAILSDVKATLTGTQTVTLIERYEGKTCMNLVITRASETPDEAATLAALNNRQTKPLGAVYILVAADSILIYELLGTVDEQAGTIDEYSAVPA